MSYPTQADFGILRYGDGDSPELFTVVCGVQNVTVNETADTNNRLSYDCAKPGKLPVQTVRVVSTSYTVSGTGVLDTAGVAATRALIGKKLNWKVDLLADDGTDEGELLGTYAGRMVLTSRNTNIQRGGDSQVEYQLQGEGDLTWTPAA